MKREVTCKELCEFEYTFDSATINVYIHPGHFETQRRAAGWTDWPNGAQGQISELSGYVSYRSKCDVVVSIRWISKGKIGGTFADLYKFSDPEFFYGEATESWYVEGASIDDEQNYEDFCNVDEFVRNIGWEKHAKHLFPKMDFVDYDIVNSDMNAESTYFYQLENHVGPTIRFNGVLIKAIQHEEYWGKVEYYLYMTMNSNKLLLYKKIIERNGHGDYYTVNKYDSMASLIQSDYNWIIDEIRNDLDDFC